MLGTHFQCPETLTYRPLTHAEVRGVWEHVRASMLRDARLVLILRHEIQTSVGSACGLQICLELIHSRDLLASSPTLTEAHTVLIQISTLYHEMSLFCQYWLRPEQTWDQFRAILRIAIHLFSGNYIS